MKTKAKNAPDYTHIFPLLCVKPEVMKSKVVTVEGALKRLAWLQAVSNGNQADFVFEHQDTEPVEEFYSLHAYVLNADSDDAFKHWLLLEQQACERKLIATMAKDKKIRDHFGIYKKETTKFVAFKFRHQPQSIVLEGPAFKKLPWKMAKGGFEEAQRFTYDDVVSPEGASAVVQALKPTPPESPSKKARK